MTNNIREIKAVKNHSLLPENLLELRAMRDKPPKVVSAAVLKDKTPRTLIYGYFCDRDTFHLYLDELGRFCRIVYNYSGQVQSSDILTTIPVEQTVPDKRVYPEACDLEFCKIIQPLLEYGIPFTTYNNKRERQTFHGKLIEDFKESDYA